MKKTLLLTLLAATASLNILAQKDPIKFGDIPMEDMRMKVYPLDTTAEAVVLADYGTSVISYTQKDGFQLNFERTRRIKILKKDGLRFAEFRIPTWHNDLKNMEEKINGLKLNTYNLQNGKIVVTKVSSDSFFKERFDDNLNFTKVAWTNVNVGSIIEITYRIKSDFLFNFMDWEFQSTIPVRWSEYRAQIPEYYGYEKYMQGYVALAINERNTRFNRITFISTADYGAKSNSSNATTNEIEYEEENFRWAAKDVPAFRVEPYISNEEEYKSRLNFELAYTKIPGEGVRMILGSWEEINRSYLEKIGSDVNIGLGLKEEVNKIISGITNDQEKAQRIFDYVRFNVLWDESYRTIPESNPGRTLSNKRGSSAEINVLLTSMLNRADLKANAVLISTRDHGFVRPTIAVASQFNSLICVVKLADKQVLLDATDRNLAFGSIPEKCLNGQGLLIAREGPQWVALQSAVKSRTMYNADIRISENGNMECALKIDRSGYHSADVRQAIGKKGKEAYIKRFEADNSLSIEKSEFQNFQDISQPVKEVYKLTSDGKVVANNNVLYINPFVVAQQNDNPFKSEKRHYPVDFAHNFENSYMARIVIPDGYVVEELPVSKMLGMPENAARYVYNVTQSGNVINFMSGLTVNRSLFTQEEYPNLREFYSQVVAKQAEQIVLKKK